MPLVNSISQLNEPITLVSYTMGNVNGVPVSNVRKEHFTTWALVLSQYLSEGVSWDEARRYGDLCCSV